jgi:uncharacterized membrane protein
MVTCRARFHFGTMQSADAPLFEIRMAANSSLSVRGLQVVIVLLTAASLLIGVFFWRMGAWPVPGFCGVEVLVAVLLLRRNARGACATEAIVLSRASLLLRRTDVRGQTSETRLVPFWLRVELLDRPAAPVRVRLVGHGVSEEVGGLLGEDARRDLARTLRAALQHCNSPNFDNPQLRS